MPVIVTKTIHGRRAVPIDQSSLDKMLKSGTARKVNAGGNLYEEIESDDDCPIPIAPIVEPVYETKVMAAEVPKRKPGRPAKVSA